MAQFEAQLRASALFHPPAGTADKFAEQPASVVCEELNHIAPLKLCKRRQSKPITCPLRRCKLNVFVVVRSGSDVDRTAHRNAGRHANELINSSRRYYHRLRLQDCSDARQRWRMVKELVHVVPNEAWRTDAYNSVLCDKFAKFCYN